MSYRTRVPRQASFKFRCAHCDLWTLQEVRVQGEEVSGLCTHCLQETREPLDDYSEHRYLSILGIQHLLEDIHPELAELKRPGDWVALTEDYQEPT